MQPEKVAQARSWFERANDDLRAAVLDLTAAPPLIGDALFHCQQAIEKAFKGFLTWHDQPFRKVHDLREIGGAVLAVEITLTDLVRQAIPVSPYATVFRYPFPTPEPTLAEAQGAVALARRIYTEILTRLPEELHLAGPPGTAPCCP